MKISLRGASSAALLFGLIGAAFPAWGQESVAPQEASPPEAAGDDDRVVVTGSFFAGTPEDTALPVETFSMDDLTERGAPSALDFAKSLTISGPTRGGSFTATGGNGNVQYNLRGLGADKTLTLLNGRRTSENALFMPAAALARVEVLKDGAAVTYGADASGGVVNFITRRDFVGFEASAKYKAIDGSDGDYGISMLGGFGDGDTNFLFSLEWEHTSELDAQDRERMMESMDRAVNPGPWSNFSNMAVYTAFGARPAYPGANGQPPNTRNGEFGTPIAGTYLDYNQQSCEAMAGSYTPTACWVNWATPHYLLADIQDTYRAFGQVNAAINDDIDFNIEALYGQTKLLTNLSPGNVTIRGPARTLGSTFQFYVPRENPGFAEFATRSGLAGAPGFANVAGVSPSNYRIFGLGGNPYWGNNAAMNVVTDLQSWRVASGLKGRLGDAFGPLADVNFDTGITYNQTISYNESPDTVGYKAQQAMYGFGGPNCGAPDLDPYTLGTQNPGAAGKNGCLWFNPFASGIVKHWTLDLANPNFVPALENSREVIDWMNDKHEAESTTTDLTIDAVFSGATPIELPGGPLAVALGAQGRMFEFRETVTNPLHNGSVPCMWPSGVTSGNIVNGVLTPVDQQPLSPSDPLFTGCTPDLPGSYLFRGLNVPDYNDQQQFSVFTEMQIPVLDNLNFQAAVRREEFSGGLGATVYKISGKWDVLEQLSFRGSYGTNYQAPPATLIPGDVSSATSSITRAASTWRGLIITTVNDVVPETATAWNLGAIWKSQGFGADHDLSLIVDYFDIETKDEIGQLASINDIVNSVFSGAAVPGQAGYFFADCSSPFLARVQLNDSPQSPGGTCIQGTTHSDQIGSIFTDLGNGAGNHTAGFDIQANYTLPVGPGDLSLDATATVMTTMEREATTLDGVVITAADNRLGFLNYSGSADAAPELRANASVAYKLDVHNFRFGVNYISAVEDERTTTVYGKAGEEWIVADFTWLWEVLPDLRLSTSVFNIFDRDPPRVQQEMGFDPLLGNPYGRMFEVSVKKTF